MRLVFITNFVHHHQVPLADELYKILGDDYKYIATDPLPEWLIKGGYDAKIQRTYIVKDYESRETHQYALKLADEADVVIIGSASEEFIKERLKSNKLTFRYSERWFKKRPWFLTGIRGWRNYYLNHIRYNRKPLYLLAASAYTANDAYAIGAYKNKVFKWGYFTQVPTLNVEEVLTRRKENRLKRHQDVSILWVARLIGWKHPELPIILAKRLKDDGYKFCIDMFGSGEKETYCRTLAHSLGVEDVVHFQGNRPNDEILEEMRNHDIFLFTSDKNEGWGAVLNEAMSNACAVVASDKIGAVPFLIQDGKNGLIFESQNGESLYRKVKYLMDNPQSREQISRNAYNTMSEFWNPQNAANRLIHLCINLQKHQSTPYNEGPCSQALPWKY